ncbi:MAG: gamma-glutamylcyclotransferase family protein [Gammaproteobacteria bacterium]
MRLFCYGTLQFPRPMARVSGLRPRARPAVLKDYGCYILNGAVYPGIRPEPGMRTPGVIYDGIDMRRMARLDRYEGDEYVRQRVQVHTADARLQEAWVYIIHPEVRACLSDIPWDRYRFERQHLAAWLRGAGLKPHGYG